MHHHHLREHNPRGETEKNKRKCHKCLHDAVHGFASADHNQDKPRIKDALQMRANVPTRLQTRKTVFSPRSIIAVFVMQCKEFPWNRISTGNGYTKKYS